MKTVMLIIPKTNGVDWTVEAEIIGDLALHEHSRDPKRWSITHVPTKLSLRDGIPPSLKNGTRAKARKWMKKVQEGMPKDWLAMRKFTHADVVTHPEHTRSVRERIKQHCLNTEPAPIRD